MKPYTFQHKKGKQVLLELSVWNRNCFKENFLEEQDFDSTNTEAVLSSEIKSQTATAKHLIQCCAWLKS